MKKPSADAGYVTEEGLICVLGRSPEKEMITFSSILAWRIPWTEEPGGLMTVGLQESGMT